MQQVRVIPAPGLYPQMPASEYHALDAFSNSKANVLRRGTPAALRHYLDNPPSPTDAMELGSAIHSAVLEPEVFSTSYGCGPTLGKGKGSRTTYNAEVKRIETERPGLTLLRQDRWDTVLAVRDAIRTNAASRTVLDGEHECSAVWECKETGLLCKGRFDSVGWNRCVVDLKTTLSAQPEDFQRSIWNFGYFIQAAAYIEGAQACGLDVEFFVIIAVEKTPPYEVAVYRMADDVVKVGMEEWSRLKTEYAGLLIRDTWPSYGDVVRDIGLPPYAWRQMQ